MSRTLLIAIALAVLAAPAAFAQNAPEPPDAAPPPAAAPMHRHPPLWTLDTNHDGMLSRDELDSRPGLLKHFDQIDSNGDGLLSRDELRAWHQRMKARREARMQQQSGAPMPPASSGDGGSGGNG